MKIWNGYGSEHSMNLVMIGRFKELDDAKQAKDLIDRISEQVSKESLHSIRDEAPSRHRFSPAMMDIFRSTNVYDIGAAELQQFAYDVTVKLDGKEIEVSTDEVDISAFLKILIEMGAKVEVYSAHEYPDSSTELVD